MPDFKKTQSYYEQERFPFQKNPHQIDLENWESEVSQMGVFHQDAKRPEIKYPRKIPVTIKRIRAIDGNEYLLTNQRWEGINRFGDLKYRGVSNVEMYDEPRFDHRAEVDKNNPNTWNTKTVGVIETIKRYTLPFTVENLDRLIEQTPPDYRRTLSLSVKDEAVPGIVREIKRVEDLRDKPLDDLLYPTISTGTPTKKERQ